MTACSFVVSAHVCWNWAVRAARTAIPLFILGRTLSTCRSLDMRRLGSICRLAGLFCSASFSNSAGVDASLRIGTRSDPTPPGLFKRDNVFYRVRSQGLLSGEKPVDTVPGNRGFGEQCVPERCLRIILEFMLSTRQAVVEDS